MDRRMHAFPLQHCCHVGSELGVAVTLGGREGEMGGGGAWGGTIRNGCQDGC